MKTVKQLADQVLSGITASPIESGSQTVTSQKQRVMGFWFRMGEIYSYRWTAQEGETPSNTWTALISTLTDEEINRGVSECLNDITNGKGFAPTVADFSIMAKGFSESEIDDAFSRMISQSPCRYAAEFEARTKVSYQCRTQLKESESRKVFKRALNLAVRKLGRAEVVDSGAMKIEQKPLLSDTDREIQNRAVDMQGLTPKEMIAKARGLKSESGR